MLAVLGFNVTGLLFYLFAVTITSSSHKRTNRLIELYQYGYMFLSLTFFGYGIASVLQSPGALSLSVIIGNILLLAATLLMLAILFDGHKYKSVVLYGSAFLGAAMILVRIFYFYPEPYLEDSMLFFNSQRFISFLLSAIFLLIWLPVNLRISHHLSLRTKSEDLSRLYVYVYATATFSAVIFLLAKKPVTLILSFVAISTSFLMLTASNLYIRSTESRNFGKPAK
jgi:hypothetical protein